MYKLKRCQKQAVEELYSQYLSDKKEINFQAPTGSGKTFIICNLCNEIMKNNINKKTIILFNTISTSGLQEQNYNKSKLYTQSNSFIYKNYLISSPSSSKSNNKNDYVYTIKLEDKTVYFIGNSSFKNKSILYERGELESFLKEAKNQKYEIIYIRDEAHLGAKVSNEESQNIEKLSHYFDKSFYVSATLDKKTYIDVKIEEKDAEDDFLIKRVERVNEDLEDVDLDEIDSIDLLKIAIDRFKQVKKDYTNGIKDQIINPAMLIQISSKVKGFNVDEQINEITNLLSKNGLIYVVYTSEGGLKTNSIQLKDRKDINQETKQILEMNNSPIDVIIFKVALATGWDIPRACMLVQLREVNSETLNKQTIGRIRRNPIKNLEDNPFANRYYIYSNYKPKKSETLDFLNLKNKYKNIGFKTVKLPPVRHDVIDVSIFVNRVIEDIFIKNDFLSIYQKYLIQHKKFDENNVPYISLKHGEISNEDSKKSYVTKIYNWFETERIWSETMLKDEVYFKYLNHSIDLYCEHINNKLGTKQKINPNILKLILLDIDYKHFVKAINGIYNEQNQPQNEYFVDNNILSYLPNWTIQEKTDYQFPYNENLYKKVCYENRSLLDKNSKYYYYLDSTPEEEFAKDIFKIIKNREVNIDFVTKNYLANSEIKFDYLLKDKDNYIKKASGYPDFIIKKDDAIFFVEIKSTNDYDDAKTSSLIEAYKDYSRLTDYHYCLVKVDTQIGKSPTYTWKHFYNSILVNESQGIKSSELFKLFVNY